MIRIARLTLIAVTAFATLFAAEQTSTDKPASTEAPAAAPSTGDAAANDEMKPILDSLGAIGAIISAAGKESETAEAKTSAPATTEAQPFDNPEAEIMKDETKPAATQTSGEPKVAKKRSIQKTLALITAGAAAGAAIGSQATKDKQKGAIMGAVAGSVAALIYDRVSHKNPGKI